MPNISLLLPTRGRVKHLRQFLDSAFSTALNPEDIQVVLSVDNDDRETLAARFAHANIVRVTGPRQGMGDYHTNALKYVASDLVMLVNDDIVVSTQHWDRHILEQTRSYPDGVFLAYPNDLTMRWGFCSFPILSKRACELLVSPFPSSYRRLFLDIHLMDVFERLATLGHHRLLYLESVVFEHLSNRTKDRDPDLQYHPRSDLRDDFMFLVLHPLRIAQAERLRAHLDGEEMPPLEWSPQPLDNPANPLEVVWRCAGTYLGDSQLSYKRRFSLFSWLTGHYLRTWLRTGPRMIAR